MDSIGARVKAAIEASGRFQKDVAASIGMKPDAFSRALKGERGFGALELANVARELSADIHQFITGEPDPNRLVYSARHEYDRESHKRTLSAQDEDEQLLSSIKLAYDQVANSVVPAGAHLEGLSPGELREQLGEGFSHDFIGRLENFGVDVVRLEGLSTAYSFFLSGRPVMAIPSSGSWFWNNWNLAHELGHFCHGHRRVTPSSPEVERQEAAANDFAAGLILPEDVIRGLDWTSISPESVAGVLWDWGVSTQALQVRLSSLRLPRSQHVQDLLEKNTTQKVLRQYRRPTSMFGDEITDLMTSSAQRFFPHWLRQAHIEAIAAGDVAPGTLAWMLEVDEDRLDLPEPTPRHQLSVDELDRLFV